MFCALKACEKLRQSVDHAERLTFGVWTMVIVYRYFQKHRLGSEIFES